MRHLSCLAGSMLTQYNLELPTRQLNVELPLHHDDRTFSRLSRQAAHAHRTAAHRPAHSRTPHPQT